VGRKKSTRGLETGVEAAERGRIERALDRLEERLAAAPEGLHQPGDPAEPAAIEAAGLPPAAVMFYRRFDGLEIAGGDAVILQAAQVRAATAAAEAEDRLAPGDVVIGEIGRDLFVLPADPWDEGGDVVRVDEGGDRVPEASTLAHLALGLVAEASVLYGNDGEFKDDLFGEDGDLVPAVKRRLFRRRLDFDPDAPRARLELARALLRDGEARAAAAELRTTLERAPQLSWAHHELGHALAAQGDPEGASEAHAKAAELCPDADLQAHFWAWAAMRAGPERRAAFVARVLERRPHFAAEQAKAARELLEREDVDTARDVIALGLAIAPRHLELLELQPRVATAEA
jgi:tetratricopeptide (TPR) repeat protein